MLYFIEDAKALTKELLTSHGLDDLLVSPKVRESHAGPSGKSGLIIQDASIKTGLIYKQPDQTWAARFGYPGSHVGIWTDSPPTESDLARSPQIDGPRLELLDGGRWMIPMLRMWKESSEEKIFNVSCLPKVLKQNPETGRLVSGDVVPKYRKIWQQCCDITESMVQQVTEGSIAVELDDDAVDQYVADVLRMNYRVGLTEIGLLGIVGENEYGAIVRASIDWSRLGELVKNQQGRNSTGQESEMSSTESGATQPAEELTTLTGQP